MIPLVSPSYSPADRLLAQWDTDVQVRLFEEEFADFVGCRGAVAVNSGTNALIIALRARPTDYFSIPSYTCRSLLDAVNAVSDEVDLRDNVCDVSRARFGPTVATTVVSHMFGTRDGLGLIEDLTLSLGAVQSPEIGVCSFHRDKMISTGRGGMIVAQDEAFLERCRELVYYDFVKLAVAPSGDDTARDGRDGKQVATLQTGHYSPAFSFGMTGMQAALGRSQLAQLPSFIERRRHVAAQYTEAFTEAGIECPDPDIDSVFFRYIIGVDDPADKVAKLAERGIEAGRGVNPPLHRLLDLDPAAFPGAEECWSKLLSVPVHPGLTDEQVGYITEQVIEVCGP